MLWRLSWHTCTYTQGKIGKVLKIANKSDSVYFEITLSKEYNGFACPDSGITMKSSLAQVLRSSQKLSTLNIIPATTDWEQFAMHMIWEAVWTDAFCLVFYLKLLSCEKCRFSDDVPLKCLPGFCVHLGQLPPRHPYSQQRLQACRLSPSWGESATL